MTKRWCDGPRPLQKMDKLCIEQLWDRHFVDVFHWTRSYVFSFWSHVESNALAWPTGQWSRKDEPVRVLDRRTGKEEVYAAYELCWRGMLYVHLNTSTWTQEIPTKTLYYRYFFKVWRERYSTFLMIPVGSDFCDVCKELRNAINNMPLRPARAEIITARRVHRHQVAKEYSTYRLLSDGAKVSPTGQRLHLTFAFKGECLAPPFSCIDLDNCTLLQI